MRSGKNGRPTTFGAFLVLVLLWLASSGHLQAQSPVSDNLGEKAKELLVQERWQDLVDLVRPMPRPSADLYFYYGTALAKLGRWDDAQAAFQAGSRLEPGEKRFPVELAGVAFKQKRYAKAAAYLSHVLDLAPDDAYANDFLGTVYFLQGNIDAALKYWNRVGKPHISSIEQEPVPKVNSVLLDHSFAFSPASTLRRSDLLATEARVRALGIFSSFQFYLPARDDGDFDLLFRNHERNGWGDGKWDTLISLFRGLPADTVTPEFYNLRKRAINFLSMYRWDAQKRRAGAELSGTFGRQSQRRYTLFGDWRNENWDIRSSFTGPATELGSFKLEREAIGGNILSVVGSGWSWSAGGEFSHRNFDNILPGPALSPAVLAEGYQLKQVLRGNADIWRVPEHRMVVSAAASSELGRIWSQPAHSFLKLQGLLRLHWFPQAEGDDYEFEQRILAGNTSGEVPVDELFVLGVLGDNGLWMRGHVTTHGGKKGSGPLGRRYFVSNWNVDKNLFRKYGATFKLGPFVDTGTITDQVPGLGSHRWLVDVGVQAKVRFLGMGVALIYGKDLRTGNNACTIGLE